jgi:hypothetical protein
MSEIIVCSQEQLQEAISKCIAQYFANGNMPTGEVPDTVNMESALKMLNDFGFSTSKAQLYKLTSRGVVPFRKYGNKLLFSRKELLAWAESHAHSRLSADDLSSRFTNKHAKRTVR